MIDWTAVDTVFLDVDGALIDLYYDFVLWQELLPSRLAEKRNITKEAAFDELFGSNLPKGIDLYSIPNWSRITGLDVEAMHRELTHLLRFRPGVETFLCEMNKRSTRLVIVTNAHTQSFCIKDEVLNLSSRVDSWYSSAQFGIPKEDNEFWNQLAKIEPFDPSRTLLIDDTSSVLDAARDAGIAYLFTTAQPNLKLPIRSNLEYPIITNYRELL